MEKYQAITLDQSMLVGQTIQEKCNYMHDQGYSLHTIIPSAKAFVILVFVKTDD